MSNVDTETPYELLASRLGYHWDLLDKAKFGSDEHKLHHDMSMKYSTAMGILSGELNNVICLQNILATLKDLPDKVAEKVKEA